jgi:hypothetical protein
MYVDPTSLVLYNFYKRYNWQAADFRAWQNGMIALQRGQAEGLLGAAVIDGFNVTLSSGMGVNVSAGIALGPSGYLNVVTTVTPETIAAPTAGAMRSLIIVQPNVVDGTLIQDPTVPTQTDVLTTKQQAIVSVLAGVAANSPTYPAVPAGATVLCGVRSKVGQTTLLTSDLDFTVADVVGKNSNFDHSVGVNDDRLLPYRNSNQSLGIKPSQLEPPLPRLFTYISAGTPSIFPKSGGSYNPADTFLNFQTGAISGGDTTSPAFTPTIPTAGNAIVAAAGISTSDLLVVAYGTVGTRAQCFDAIKNQTTVGAGSISLPFAKMVAFVILTSVDGANVTELDYIDARSFSSFVAAVAYPGYDIVVGGAGVHGATHATLIAADADVTQGANKRVLLADSQAIAPTNVSKASWHIDALPGIVYSKASGTSGITFSADDGSLNGLRMTGYTTAGDKAVVFAAGGTYGRARNNRFAINTDTEVDFSAVPAGKKPYLTDNYSEV